MKRLPHLLFALLIMLLMQTGCSSSVLQLGDGLYLHRGEFQQKLADNKELAAKFLTCTGQAHDELPNTRRDDGAAIEPLSTTTREKYTMSMMPLMEVIETIRRSHAANEISLSILADVLDDMVGDANAHIDLSKLQQIIETAQQWDGYPGLDEERLERDSSRFARMLLTYNKAYFGDLSFTPRSSATEAGLRGVVKTTSKGFVDRGGSAWLFPGISAEIERSPANSGLPSPSTVDSQRVSADLMRIFLEAFFDTAYRVPAVHGATALRVRPGSQELPYPEFDADHPQISLEALGRVTRDAMRAEAAVTSLVGKTVRGGSVFGTQNETLAATLETTAGVIAKKLTEHEGFCYYQIVVNQPAIAAHDQNGAGQEAVSSGFGTPFSQRLSLP
ncbi:MAG TPA: hypothetical protein VLA67_14460 [Nitrospiraceae bacterium]|nr:hypothetical protein [Nitrospiraceae bacterium]